MNDDANDDVAKLAREQRVTEAAELAASRGDARRASDLFERACAWARASAQASIAGQDARALSLAVLGGDDALAGSALARAAQSKKASRSSVSTAVPSSRVFLWAHPDRSASRAWAT